MGAMQAGARLAARGFSRKKRIEPRNNFRHCHAILNSWMPWPGQKVQLESSSSATALVFGPSAATSKAHNTIAPPVNMNTAITP